MWKQSESVVPATAPQPSAVTPSHPQSGTAHIGRSVVIQGELTGSEDLKIEGRIEGKSELRQYTVTIGEHATIQAQVSAKEVVVWGRVMGNISASERINIREQGVVEGDLVSPSVVIANGAKFRGGIDMPRDTRHAVEKAAVAKPGEVGRVASPPIHSQVKRSEPQKQQRVPA